MSKDETVPDGGLFSISVYDLHNCVVRIGESLHALVAEAGARSPSRELILNFLRQIQVGSVLHAVEGYPIFLVPYSTGEHIEIETRCTLISFRDVPDGETALHELDFDEEPFFSTGSSWHHIVVEVSSSLHETLQAIFSDGEFDVLTGLESDLRERLDSAKIAIQSFNLPLPHLLTSRLQTELVAAVAAGHSMIPPDKPTAPFPTSKPPAPERLKRRQEDILLAMAELKAISGTSRKSTDEIASKILPSLSGESLKASVADLKKRGFIDTITGRTGGCWLTRTGADMAISIEKQGN